MQDTPATTFPSRFSVHETVSRLESAVTEKGLRVFARIDHAEGAASVGMALRPTELLIFGKPEGGTPLMQDKQIVALDLPLKALAWEDAAGQVWLSYYAGSTLAARHGLSDASLEAAGKLDKALALFCSHAAGSEH